MASPVAIASALRRLAPAALLAGCASSTPPTSSVRPPGITRIAFGSCADQDQPQPIWDTIAAQSPDVFLFIGDNVYADTRDPAELRDAYVRLGARPAFARFRERVEILPIWDDHDFGENDAGADYPAREASQEAFLDFFRVPPDDPRRRRPGIYFSRVLGEPGRRVQLILLDVRYFKSPWAPRPGGEHPFYGRWAPIRDPDRTILGEAQWRWLREQLRVPAEVRLIASGFQFISEDHGWETWANLPLERERLFALLKEMDARGVVLLSGDRHKGEISWMDAGLGYPLYDVTSSGLNKGFKQWYYFEKNRHRVGVMRWGNVFGQIDVRWDLEDPQVSLQIRYEDGEIALSHRIRLSTLQPGALPESPDSQD